MVCRLFERIAAGQFDTPFDQLGQLSAGARDLLHAMLTVDRTKRWAWRCLLSHRCCNSIHFAGLAVICGELPFASAHFTPHSGGSLDRSAQWW